MKIAYFSPLKPVKSAISYYSEELLPYLSKYGEIDIFVDGYIPSNDRVRKNHRIVDCAKVDISPCLNDYDTVIYQMGNSKYHEYILRALTKHRGIVVLHDFSLHCLFADITLARKKHEEYIEEMIYNYGDQGEQLSKKVVSGEFSRLWEISPMEYPLNKRVLDSARGIIVLSDFLNNLLKKQRPGLHVKTIGPHSELRSVFPKKSKPSVQEIKKKLNIPTDAFIISTFGSIIPSKKIDLVLRAIAELKNSYKILYLLVGEVSPYYPCEEMIDNLELKDVARIIGYVDSNDFLKYIAISDICIQLRDPTHGEVAGSVCRIMGIGKPVIVSNLGWYSEIPDNCCAKVNTDTPTREFLKELITKMIENEYLRESLGKNAKKYFQENMSAERNAKKYLDFIREVNGTGIICEVSREMSKIYIHEDDIDIIETVAQQLNMLLNRSGQ